ncbi:WbqC family protein [Azospirillum doebereinerae]|uniref:WbqC family protein n=1 Tax=Azospirillum doebereinerae TaxID=92933 RepID=UPI001EE59465|nr:WbqC family protein [Azospirillum doebereinerae]MCG5238986.1 WbqC family protein [Azospirillum doebereinerae]
MTTLGIMQPYFFPYLGYFQLILAVDRGIVFDVVKYNRKSWMNRNRVLHPNGGWQYVSVPVHAPHGTPINAATVVDGEAAARRILGQLEHYRGKAPFFQQVCGLVSETFASTKTNGLCELNVRSLAVVCDYLGIAFDWTVCSEMALELPTIDHAGQWALEISSALEARRYVNAPGGREIFVSHDWESRGIDLCFLEPKSYTYDCYPYNHIENLSIIDALMWNNREDVLHYIIDTMKISK